MFTKKDIEHRTIYVINCIKDRNLRMLNGELLLEDVEEKKTLTKLPFQKILLLFIIGPISITTPLIDKCKQFNVTLIVVRANLRPVFYWSPSAEANYLARKQQYEFSKEDLSVAKALVINKIENQLSLLIKTRIKDTSTEQAKIFLTNSLSLINDIVDYDKLMGIEGNASKHFFKIYYQKNNWIARKPRVRSDSINLTLDIGYSILFNYVECFVRMFGLDPYIGVYHRLWFKRKSLICDLIEPFRCIIENRVRKAFNRGECKESDFLIIKKEYRLKHEESGRYYQMFFEVLVPYKQEFFTYIQNYYRCFMQKKSSPEYPKFRI